MGYRGVKQVQVSGNNKHIVFRHANKEKNDREYALRGLYLASVQMEMLQTTVCSLK